MRRIGQPDYAPIPDRRTDLLTPVIVDHSIELAIDADIAAHEAAGTHTEIKLTPQAESTSTLEGTMFYKSTGDKGVYVAVEE